MEKFAVDIDKVLDELEFDEDRAEKFLTSTNRLDVNRLLVSSTTLPDHGSTSLHSASGSLLESGDHESRWRPKPLPVSQKTSVSGVFSSLNAYLNSGRTLLIRGGDNSFINLNSQTAPTQYTSSSEQQEQPEPFSCYSSIQVLEHTDPESNYSKFAEEGPDLIESNTCIPSDLSIPLQTDVCGQEENFQESCMPNSGTESPQISFTNGDESACLHLISHKCSSSDMIVQDVEEDGKSFTVLNAQSSSSSKPVLSFSSVDVSEELNDEELNEYLSDLELEEEQQYQKDSNVLSKQISNGGIESHYTPQMEAKSVMLEHSVESGFVESCPISVTANENNCLPSSSSIDASSLHNDLCPDFSSPCPQTPTQPDVSMKADALFAHEDVPLNPPNPKKSTSELPKKFNASSCGVSDVVSKDSCENESLFPQLHISSDCNGDTKVFIADVENGENQNSEIAMTKTASALCSSSSSYTVESSKVTLPCDEISVSFFEENSVSDPSETNLETISNDKKLFQDDVTVKSKDEESIDLRLSTEDVPVILATSESPSTPPTLPVTPVASEELTLSLSASSTPFMTPTAVISESSEFIEAARHDDMSCGNSPEPSLDSELLFSETNQKPIRPSSLEIPVRAEPILAESTGSSEDLPNAVIGPPGATPCANRPSMAESLAEPQGTDESATESSIDEGMYGALSGEEPSDVSASEHQLGREPPFWVPDSDAPCCMQCDFKFTVLKRRHHCRACGKVLCSKCCSEKAYLEYVNAEARVCVFCKSILVRVGVTSPASPETTSMQPNPNNPMEYCSTVPPLLQVAGSSHHQATPTVMVPVGVLKREGSSKPKSEAKQVMFSDGIRPGADLAELYRSVEPRLSVRRTGRNSKRVGTPPGNASSQRPLPPVDGTTMCYVPHGEALPPIVIRGKDGFHFEEDPDPARLLAIMRDDSAHPVKFTINRNLFVLVKILTLDCCVNRICWCFTSEGLSAVGQDEIVIILEVDAEESVVPKDVFIHLNTLYMEAAKGNTVTEMGHTLTQGSLFLGSKDHGGFLYFRPTFQCLHRLILPPAPYLVGFLIHKWETPWARVFPIRLMLRLGAEFRYYPYPLVSIRQRPSVYGELGHTIIQLLADFRNMVYTLPTVKGLLIHMEDKQTTILLPRNRYDQVMRALNNSNDHVLAFGANFSQAADSHLVCMQSETDHSYYSQAINIQNKPRKVTGASFIVFTGALKVSEGMAAKSTIVEDGLMVKVTSDTMASLKTALRDMKDLSITCGPLNSLTECTNAGALPTDVLIKWSEDDKSFNIGVLSCVDGRPLDGVPSIRVHNGTDYRGESRFIRWTEVFILESEEGLGRTGDPVDISRLSEQLAKATCLALVKLLDLLAAASLTTLAVRATIHPENVGYQAGSNGEKLPPIYMNSLDDELVPVLHEAGLMSGESPAVLELVFRIMESG